MSKRTRVDITADMLSAIQEAGRLRPTRLMYKANLSYPQLKEFLTELIARSLVERVEEKGHDFLSLTVKGHEFITNYKKLREFEQNFGLDIWRE